MTRADDQPSPGTESGPKTLLLIQCLDELVALLRTHVRAHPGGEHWAQWMSAAATDLRAGDFRGITKTLGASGGMGSFTDVVFSGETPESAHSEFDRLRSRAFRLADAIRRGATFE